ncbi:hypothetical protein AALP_AA6G221600 [Arabis alpina]|uniref:Uncharacterized protein n=1 Tax=Arabis alpina TaxID=50452 RepID=A0A087GQX6_ARAAL|nr:hypothetical protein AALP_AA6G221600 [Arabis alpina]
MIIGPMKNVGIFWSSIRWQNREEYRAHGDEEEEEKEEEEEEVEHNHGGHIPYEPIVIEQWKI